MVRFNKKGDFNAPIHLTRSGIQPDRFLSILNKWHDMIKNITFTISDYSRILNDVKSGDFIFLAPPYSGSGSMYTNDIFNPEELFLVLEELNRRNVNWMLTYDGVRGIERSGVIVPDNLYKYTFPFGEGRSAFTALTTKAGKKHSEDKSATNFAYLNYVPDIKNPLNSQLTLL